MHKDFLVAIVGLEDFSTVVVHLATVGVFDVDHAVSFQVTEDNVACFRVPFKEKKLYLELEQI